MVAIKLILSIACFIFGLMCFFSVIGIPGVAVLMAVSFMGFKEVFG